MNKSKAQAKAFASVLDSCLSESRNAGYTKSPFCEAALFDAGDGYNFSDLSADKWEHYPEYGEYGGRWAEHAGKR